MSDSLYNDFCLFIQDKDYDYVTRTEKNINRLESQAKEDKYYDMLSSEFMKLKLTMQNIINKDTENHKSELKELLEQEIVHRYYYQRGDIEVQFDDDMDWASCKEILTDSTGYNQYLTP